MRSRNIKPGFFKNEVLGECSPLTRLLFAGLWCMADRDGRLEYRPKRIKAEILPYDDSDIEQLLGCLIKNNFVELYTVDNKDYLSITAWDKHQSPHMKEAKSTIPPPNKHQTSTVQEPDKHQNGTEEAALIPDSLNLIPDSNNPPTPQGASVSVVKSYQYPEWLNKSLWADFVKMRNKKKKPILTEKTISNLIKALQKLISAGYEQDDIIQAAIDNVWQSFYPPKGQGGWEKEKEQPQSQHKIYKAGDKRYAD